MSDVAVAPRGTFHVSVNSVSNTFVARRLVRGGTTGCAAGVVALAVADQAPHSEARQTRTRKP